MKNTVSNLLTGRGEAFYYPGVFYKDLADVYFNQLFVGIRWKQEPVRLFGKEIMQPRLTAWYGDMDKQYKYSGLNMAPNHWIHPLLTIKSVVDNLSGVTSTSALLNLYRDGMDGLGWHRDNEKVLGLEPVIASVSLGASRIFQFRNYTDKKQVISIELESGSVLIMKGESQKHWEHRVPKTKKKVMPRISITFRVIE